MTAAPKLELMSDDDATQAEASTRAPHVELARPRQIPSEGRPRQAVLDEMKQLASHDAAWRDGKVFCLVYHAGEEHEALLKDAHNLFFSENGLNPMAFQSLKRMEGDVVRMTASMLHGGEEAVGTLSSGGTESILLAVKTYRDRARRRRPWIRRPEMVIPRSAHVAFLKAGKLFDVKVRIAPLREDYRVDVAAMKRLVNRNTILLVGSAPQYVQGVIDPIEEIGAFAKQKKLPLHVDACIGGFMLPWLEKLGERVPPWDFRVPGVTSISADLHKYGYAAKGSSVIVYRDMSYLRHQFYVATDWPGGIYASPSLPGTRPGGPIAASWAALLALGEDGYLELARRTLAARNAIARGVASIDGIHIVGEPDSTLLSIASDDDEVDIYAVADQLEDKGWRFDRQQGPPSLHLTIMPAHEATADDFLRDLEDAVRFVRAHPEVKSRGNAAMYGMMAKIPSRALVAWSVRKVMEGMYGPGGEAPDLSSVGQGDDDGLVMKLVGKHGDKVLQALDRVDSLKQELKRSLPFMRGGGR